MPAELASRAATLLDGLLAGRYGGDRSSVSSAAAGAVVEALELSFQAAARARRSS